MLHEKALSKKQQRFFGIVRATQKGTFKGETTPQVQRAASDMKKKDVKKFASTKHKGLPEKKVKKEEASIQEGSSKSCPKGQYYCFTDKKCKKIPGGYIVGRRGYLEKEEDSEDSKKNGKNGNGNGNGNGGSTNGNGGNGSGGNGGGGNGGGMGEEVTHEAVAAIPAIAGASKVIPAVVAGVGALGTIMQAQRGRPKGEPSKRYNRNKPKRKISDMERKLTDRLNKQNVGNSRVGKAFDTTGLDLNKKSNLITPKDGQVMQDSFVPEAKESNPRIPRKKGQPANSKKHSDLYTDENPKGTIHGLGFKDVATAKASVSKIRNSSRSHAHKIQAAVAMEQRAREMGKTSEAAIFRKYINQMKKKTKEMNEAKNAAQQAAIAINMKRKGKKPKKVVENKVAFTYKSGSGFDANIGGTSVKNTIQNIKTAGETIKNIRNKGLVRGVKQTFANNTPPKKSVSDKVSDAISQYKLNMGEGSLHKWFKGSKSKDGKGGWVNVVTGGTCASDEPGEGTPKCVSSSKRASMSKAERLSAARRKKKADPNQQQKSGAAKPTYVSTDKPKKKMKEAFSTDKYKEIAKREADLKRKEDLKVKSKKESVEIDEAKVDKGKSESDKINNRNQRAFGNRRNANYMQKYDDMERRRYNTEKGRGVKTKGQKDKRPMDYHTRDKNARLSALFKSKGIKYPVTKPSKDDKYRTEDFYRKKYDVKDGGYKKTTKMDKSNKRAGDSKAQYRELHKDLAKIKTEGMKYGLYKGDGKVKFKLNKPEKKKEKELKEYSPNVSYQAKGGKKSGRLSKSSVYSLRGKDESKKDFRKSHTKDIKDGLMKHESIFTPLVFSVSEAKIDKIDPKNKRERRNIAKFGPQTKPYDPPTKEMKTSMGKFMQKQRQDMHDKKRGVKTKVKEDHVPLTGDAKKTYDNLVKMAKDKNLDMKKRQGADAALTQGGHSSVLNKEESDKKGKGSGSKDACYHKVKSRYSVWPSAYASGALVKCRKVGAANWGNSSKKEDYGIISFQDFIYEKCWKGYEKKGMKTMFGKRYPNCVKKEEVETKKKPKKAMDAGARARRILQRREYKAKVSEFIPKELEDHVVYENDRLINTINKAANYMQTSDNPIVRGLRKVFKSDGGKNYPTKQQYQNSVQKNSYEPEGQVLEASAAWQRKAGKNSKGGLNEKGRKSYEAQNPGSDLKAPVTGKVKPGGKAAKRRKSFCARMGGMKGPMKKPNGEPTRKALALRKWKC